LENGRGHGATGVESIEMHLDPGRIHRDGHCLETGTWTPQALSIPCREGSTIFPRVSGGAAFCRAACMLAAITADRSRL
jgi:hypothetical protein